MSAPEIAAQLSACGVGSFPCTVRHNPAKNKWEKNPRVEKDEDWRDVAARPLDDPRTRWSGTTVIGVPVPVGVVIVDLDTYKPGCTRETAEAALGCALPWDAALIQRTIGGGEHYAFSAPDWAVRQLSDVNGLKGLDTRIGAKGFICTGAGYTEHGFGLRALGYPTALPRLPDAARTALEHVPKAPAPERPHTEPSDGGMLREALRHIDPGCGRTDWVRTVMALRHQFGDDADGEGLALCDEWSSGALWPDGTPHNYAPEDIEHQWGSIKPTGETTVATLYYQALQGGWIPPAAFDTSSAFGGDAAPAPDFNRLVARIQESGGDVTQTTAIVEEILAARCNAMQRDLLTLALKAGLKGGGLLDKRLSDKLDAQLRPDTVPYTPPTPIALPDVLDITDVPPRALGRPTGIHGQNAIAMQQEVFGDRIRRRQGTLRWWSGREWQGVPDDVITNLTYLALMPDQCKAPNVAGTRAAMVALCDELPDCLRDYRVYFRNCIIDAGTGQVTAHHARNWNTGSLQADYVPDAQAPQWLAFLETLFGGTPDGHDRIALLQEIMGWALLSDDLNVQKIVAFDGASRAGKGVALEVLKSLLGPERAGVITFSDIADGKTQSVLRRYDVVLDIEAKPPRSQEVKTAIGFMNKVASNEEVSIQLLNTQQPWSGRLNCKMLLACNGIPAMLDDSGATTNRFLVLYFTRSFAGREDKTILSRVLAEKDAIALWALRGAQRLIASGGQFTMPATSVDAMADLKGANQPLSEFIDEYLEFDAGHKCHAGDIWTAYKLYAQDSNTKLGSKNAFGRSLQRALLGSSGEYRRSLRIGDTVTSGYTGLRVRDLTLTSVPTSVGWR